MGKNSAALGASRSRTRETNRLQLRLYSALGGDSGVTAYAVGPDFIVVEFKSRDAYRYDYSKPGRAKVEKMKRLARRGGGLATFINQHVREDYAEKLW
jgi:hypothetical protein